MVLQTLKFSLDMYHPWNNQGKVTRQNKAILNVGSVLGVLCLQWKDALSSAHEMSVIFTQEWAP